MNYNYFYQYLRKNHNSTVFWEYFEWRKTFFYQKIEIKTINFFVGNIQGFIRCIVKVNYLIERNFIAYGAYALKLGTEYRRSMH